MPESYSEPQPWAAGSGGASQRLWSNLRQRLRLLARTRRLPFRRSRLVFPNSRSKSVTNQNSTHIPFSWFPNNHKNSQSSHENEITSLQSDFSANWGFPFTVHGVEYAFGAHDYPTTGIFEAEPKQCEGFTFRKSILIGWTEMTPGQVRVAMEVLAQNYRGDAYNLITKNCNHFCNDACIKLTGNPIPGWVNRLARIGKKPPSSQTSFYHYSSESRIWNRVRDWDWDLQFALRVINI